MTIEAALRPGNVSPRRSAGRRGRLDLLVRAGAEAAGPLLVAAGTRARLAKLPTCFDGALSWGMLEIRLDADARTDLVLHLERAGRRSVSERCPQDWSAAAHFAAWCDSRSAFHRAPTLTVELDGLPGGWGQPFVFAALESETGVRPGKEAWELVGETLALGGGRAPGAVAKALQQLPASAWPAHIASLAPRGRAGARLVVSIPPGEVAAYLRRLRWKGDIPRVGSLVASVGAALGRLNLHLDLGDRVGDEVGIEIFYPGAPGRDPRWAPVFEALRPLAQGAPEKLAALAAWPCRKGPLVRLLGIKIVTDVSGAQHAKAYLAHRWVAPGT